jgi:hypothetical protein
MKINGKGEDMITQESNFVKIIVTRGVGSPLVTYEDGNGQPTYDRSPTAETLDELAKLAYSGAYEIRPVLSGQVVGFEMVAVCMAEGCHEPRFRDGLCWHCYREEMGYLGRGYPWEEDSYPWGDPCPVADIEELPF